MPKALPIRVRRLSINEYLSGEGGYRKVAAKFGVGEATVNRLIAKHRRGESIEARAMGGDRKSRILADEAKEWIVEQLLEKPTLTMRELVETYQTRWLGDRIPRSSMVDIVHRLGFTKKKLLEEHQASFARTWSRPEPLG